MWTKMHNDCIVGYLKLISSAGCRDLKHGKFDSASTSIAPPGGRSQSRISRGEFRVKSLRNKRELRTVTTRVSLSPRRKQKLGRVIETKMIISHRTSRLPS
jgi:hypothetical protein